MLRSLSRFILCPIFLSCIFIAYGCQKSTPVSLSLLDQIQIQPVTTPTVYRYGPCVGEIEMDINNQLPGESSTMSMVAKYSVIQEEQYLLWHVFIPRWTENDKRYNPRIPLADVAMTTTLRGEIVSSEATFPLLQGIKHLPEDAKAQLEAVKNQIQDMAPDLPEKAIVTGEILRTVPLSTLPEGLTMDKNKLNFLLAGEFILNDTAYVVAVLDEELIVTDSASGLRLALPISGKSIMRKDSMDTVDASVQFDLLDMLNEKHGEISITMKRLNN